MKTPRKVIFVSEKRVLYFHPEKLISLWEMIAFIAVKFHDDLLRLEGEVDSHVISTPEAPIFTPEQRGRLIDVLGLLMLHCREHQMEMTLNRCNELRHALEVVPEMWMTDFDIAGLEPTTDYIFKSCDAIKLLLIRELGERHFAFIPANLSGYFEQECLFGETVNKSFPSAVPEIKDAGNALAADLNTAAVFHLMRTVEYGLRSLARHLKIKIRHHIEEADWGTIIGGIEAKLHALGQKPRGKKKTADLAFYRLAKDDCNLFKDVWRNNVMHTKQSFNASEALGVFTRVRGFMQRLAGNKVSAIK